MAIGNNVVLNLVVKILHGEDFSVEGQKITRLHFGRFSMGDVVTALQELLIYQFFLGREPRMHAMAGSSSGPQISQSDADQMICSTRPQVGVLH